MGPIKKKDGEEGETQTRVGGTQKNHGVEDAQAGGGTNNATKKGTRAKKNIMQTIERPATPNRRVKGGGGSRPKQREREGVQVATLNPFPKLQGNLVRGKKKNGGVSGAPGWGKSGGKRTGGRPGVNGAHWHGDHNPTREKPLQERGRLG